VRGKTPYFQGWNRREIPRIQIAQELLEGKATGYALLTGRSIIAIDCDSFTAHRELTAFVGEIPLTIALTSGKQGRIQYLFQIQGDYPLNRKIIAPDLELRYHNSQSVLPPSLHPDTQLPYRWVHSPWEVDIAPLPTELLKFLAVRVTPTIPPEFDPKTDNTRSIDFTAPTSGGLIDLLSPIAQAWVKSQQHPIPLIHCLSKRSRDWITCGEREGYRNEAGYRLAVDAIGTTRYLQSEGIHYSGNPQDYFADFIRHCQPSPRERDLDAMWLTWQSAHRRYPSPSCPPHAIAKKLDRWILSIKKIRSSNRP
jgi:hypothetical protein